MGKIRQTNYYFCNDQIDLKDSVNPLYFIIDEMIGHFEEKNENKYLVLDEIDENKEVLNKYKEVWEGIKKEIETINGGEKIEYGKDF